MYKINNRQKLRYKHFSSTSVLGCYLVQQILKTLGAMRMAVHIKQKYQHM